MLDMRALAIPATLLLAACSTDLGAAPAPAPTTNGSPRLAASPEPVATSQGEESEVPGKEATFTFLVVSECCGKGNATLIEAPDATILVDAGYARDDPISIDLLPMLAHVERFDLVVGTHPHQDHIGQLAEIINAFEVDAVWMVGSTPPPSRHLTVHQAAVEAAGEWHEPHAGERHQIGSLEIEILHPETLLDEHRSDEDLNHDSIVMRITYGQISVLLSGDALHSAEAEMLARGGDLSADILELGHHGMGDANSPEWIAAVSPAVAIFSGNDPHLPDERTLESLRGVPTYGTGPHGRIVVSVDGQSFTITTEQPRPPIGLQ